MIARIIWVLIPIILLSDIYIYRHFLRRPTTGWRWMRVLWWVQTLAVLAWTWQLSRCRDFTPQPADSLYIYLLVLGVYILPKFLFVAGRVAGRWLFRFPTGCKWGRFIGLLLGALLAYITIYGSFWGFYKFEVRRVDYVSADLPEGFDGYRIALWSDAHLGCYTGRKAHLLSEVVDSLNALSADAVFFLGDIQNTRPDEIVEHVPTLSRLKASDGVFSILGNHDYSHYMGGTREEKLAEEERTKNLERSMGWRLLLNENTLLRHGGDSIALAGMEGNDGKEEDHGRALFEKAIEGIPDGLFTIMLLHNPYLWRKHIVPTSSLPLTLSGHTHGGQVRLFGITPSSLIYQEEDGLYERDGQSIFVTRGLGALIPLRFNVTGEVVLLTLHKK